MDARAVPCLADDILPYLRYKYMVSNYSANYCSTAMYLALGPDSSMAGVSRRSLTTATADFACVQCDMGVVYCTAATCEQKAAVPP